MDDTDPQIAKVSRRTKIKEWEDVAKSHWDFAKIVSTLLLFAILGVACLLGFVPVDQIGSYLFPGLIEYRTGGQERTVLAPNATAQPLGAAASAGGGPTSKPASGLNSETKDSVPIYPILASGSDEGSRVMLEEFRQELGQRGFLLASAPEKAMLICELSGAVLDRSATPGAVVNARMTARWRATSGDLLTVATSKNGVGSTPEAAASRAYRNAASELFGQFDGFVQRGGTP